MVTTDGLAAFFNNLYKFLIGIAATLAVIEIIWGGIEIATKDSVIAQGDGKKRIEQAILGLVLVLSPVLVFSLIQLISPLHPEPAEPELDAPLDKKAHLQTASLLRSAVWLVNRAYCKSPHVLPPQLHRIGARIIALPPATAL